jgi:mannose-1-phosphate guanylyltransferase/phosphomannomutase
LPDGDYGTAGAVKLAQEYIGDENFIIISGDLVTDFDFEQLFTYHKQKQSQLTIGLTSVSNPLEFGVVIANEEGRIEKFLEKPSWGEVFSDTINTGIYIIEPEILEYIPKNENYDFGKDLFPLLMREDIPMMAHTMEGYWRDVGNPESYRDVYEDIFADKVKFHISGDVKQYPNGLLYSDGPIELDDSIEIIGKVILAKDVVIGKGSKLHDVVIGPNVRIGEDAKLRNCAIWDSVSIGVKANLDGCVICNDNSIGKDIYAKAGLILSEGCEIGDLVKIEQDVTIWPDKIIEDAAIVSHSLVLGNKYKNSIFANGMVMGKSNVELSCEMATKLAEAFGAQLPVGSKVLVSRDYNKSSRMLKRAFLGGLLASGVDAVDFQEMPSAVVRFNLHAHEEYAAGVHFRQHVSDPTSTVITFYNHEGLRINSEIAKKVEKAFFKETFRRVDYDKIGAIHEAESEKEQDIYANTIVDLYKERNFRCEGCRVVVDMMHGTAAKVFPQIFEALDIEHILLNTYPDEVRIQNINALIKQSQSDISTMTTSLDLHGGFMIFPYGQRLDIISDDGKVLNKQDSLYVVLSLLNREAERLGMRKRVFLPTWAADITYFEHLDIDRGKYANFTKAQMADYDLIATGEGNFSFTEFTTHRDSMYAVLKILEMMLHQDVKLSTLIQSIQPFYYVTHQVECSQALKGKMMRKFLEDAKDKRASTLDGVKIWMDENDWILMIPDQYSDHLNLYIQAEKEAEGEKILEHYMQKIQAWSNE